MKASASIEVDRPPEEVWAFVSDPVMNERWVTGVRDVRWTSEGRGAGATFASKYDYRGRTFDITYEITAFEPPSRMGVRSTAGPFPFSAGVALAPSGAGVRVTSNVDAGPDSKMTSLIFAVARPLVRRGMERQLLRDLERLREALPA